MWGSTSWMGTAEGVDQEIGLRGQKQGCTARGWRQDQSQPDDGMDGEGTVAFPREMGPRSEQDQ